MDYLYTQLSNNFSKILQEMNSLVIIIEMKKSDWMEPKTMPYTSNDSNSYTLHVCGEIS